MIVGVGLAGTAASARVGGVVGNYGDSALYSDRKLPGARPGLELR